MLGIGGNKGSRFVNSKRTVPSGNRPHSSSSIVVRQVYAGGASAATTPPNTTISQPNPVSIITAAGTQQQPIHTLGEQQQHQQHAQIISVSAAPTILHATAPGTNNGPAVGGNVNAAGGGVTAGNFGGKYVLVQRAAHIGEIVTPRAASAPPTHNQ
uniref:Uncharacterized protein n=1 Tax=Anopheles dirus TaxID=7168 RepID=A0A182N9Q0_9DIPT